jgi:hypothetical protein
MPALDPNVDQVPGVGLQYQPQPLRKNPMLPQHPLGRYTDSIYEAKIAQLRADTAKKHADLLRQLGHTNEQGQFIMGDVESEAARQRTGLQRSLGLAREDVTNQMQRAGTLFSGYRGTQQARAEHPYAEGIADLDVATARQLGDLTEQQAGLTDQFTRDQNLALAEAAGRATNAIVANPVTPALGGAGVKTQGSAGVGLPPPKRFIPGVTDFGR